MISIESYHTGSDLMRQIANDEEEFAYALAELTENDARSLGIEVAGYVDAEAVAKWLRDLADAIEEGFKP